MKTTINSFWPTSEPFFRGESISAAEMTSKERIINSFERKPVDMLPAGVWPWPTTINRWTQEGHLRPGEDPYEHFQQDIRCHAGDLNSIADIDHENDIIEETDETILMLDGNGAKLRHHKLHESMPEHVDFTVTDRAGWLERIKPHLIELDKRRIPFQQYRNDKKLAEQNGRYFCWHGMAPFEQMHPMCGHENLLMGFALDPQWGKDMVMTYADFTINHLEVLFAEEGLPDGLWFSEDLGYKEKPFMSTDMYKEILQPGHKLLFEWAHSKGCKVVLHSCGYVEQLVPYLIEAGIDCLQGMESKAGMNLPKLAEKFGEHIIFFGGIDVRTLATNDRKIIEEELQKKVKPVIQKGCGYILHCDHSEPPQVDYDTMHFFIKRGREIAAETVKAKN